MSGNMISPRRRTAKPYVPESRDSAMRNGVAELRVLDAPGNDGSGDDVGCDLVFDEGDAVAQLQLALLQPLQPQQVRRRRLMQRVDRRIEITMLLLQPGELVFELALIFVGHGLR